MASTHHPMKLSRDEELFLRHWIYDEAHFRDGVGPAKRLQIEHRIIPADLAAIIAAGIPDPQDQEIAASTSRWAHHEINSIPDPEVVNPIDPTFILGDGSVVTTGHKIDFTDRVEIGRRVILGGRNSSLWTHNRQRTMPITIGPKSS